LACDREWAAIWEHTIQMHKVRTRLEILQRVTQIGYISIHESHVRLILQSQLYEEYLKQSVGALDMS